MSQFACSRDAANRDGDAWYGLVLIVEETQRVREKSSQV